MFLFFSNKAKIYFAITGKYLRITLLLFSFIISCLSALSQTTYIWNGTTPDWNNATNWLPNGSINQSFLHWDSAKGANSSVNNANLKSGSNYLRRIVFLPTVTKTYTITGDTIQLNDPRSAAEAEGTVRNRSSFNQQVLAPLFFNGDGRIGIILTDSTGPMSIGKIILGNNLTFFRVGGATPNGIIRLTDKISGNKPFFLALNSANQFMLNTRVHISGNNSSFTGPFRINAGIARAMSDTALGFTSQFADVSSGATLELAGGINLTGRPILINGGSGVSGKGSISNVSDSNRILSQVMVASNSSFSSDAGTLVIDSIGKLSGVNWNLTFTGIGDFRVKSIGALGVQPSFNALNKSNTGIFYLDGPSNHVGPTQIQTRGTIVLGGDQFLPSANAGNRLELTNGILVTNGFNQDFRILNVSGTSSESSIYLGTTNPNQKLRFYASNNQNWGLNARLIIYNWQGSAGSSGTRGKIFIAKDTANGLLPGLTEAQLSSITFNGFCNGATLLPDGELVPSTLPFIRDSRGIPSNTNLLGGAAGLLDAGYVGYTVRIRGCGFNTATKVTIGSDLVSFTALNDGEIIFTLGDNQQGIIKVENSAGVQESLVPFSNLGYINKSINPTLVKYTDDMWLGTTTPPPPADRSLTVHRANVTVDDTAQVNLTNTVSTVTISHNNTTSILRLAVPNAIQDSAILFFESGWLQTHNGGTTSGFLSGTDQYFKELRVYGTTTTGTVNISLGNGRHDLRFGKCDTLGPAFRKILIYNWKGAIETTGDSGRIYFGANNAALTPAQLRQIQFVGFCPGAKLLNTGELVPSAAPFINNVLDTTGLAYRGYIGTKIRIDGCQLDSVKQIKIGDYEISSFEFNNDSTNISFFVEPNVPSLNNGDTLRLFTDDPGNTGVGNRFRNLGYISQDTGAWSNPLMWYGNSLPLPGKNVTIAHVMDVDMDILPGAALDSITVNAGAQLQWQQDKNLTVKHIVNNGTLLPAAGSILTIEKDGSIRNRGIFDSQGFLTVNFLDSARVWGGNTETQCIFHNIVINNGNVTFPSGTGGNSDKAAVITGTVRINGGRFFAGSNSNTFSLLKFEFGSTLIYSSGGNYTRGPEWFRSIGADFDLPGYPFNVIVDNNTNLSIENSPTPVPVSTPATLSIRGNLNIANGRVLYIFSSSPANPPNPPGELQVLGNFILGSDTATTTPTGFTSTATFKFDNARNSLKIAGDFIVHANGTLDFLFGSNPTTQTNRQPIQLIGTQNSVISSPGRDTLKLNSVLIRKNPEVTLNTILEIADTIVFISGVINTSAQYPLYLKTTAISAGGTSSSFVNGPMRKGTASSPNATGPFQFQVGKRVAADTLLYRPIWIAALKHLSNTETQYEAEFQPTKTNESPFDASDDPVDEALISIWQTDWWEVKKVTNASNDNVGARVGIPYTTGRTWTPPGPCVGCNVAVAKYFGSPLNSWKFTKPAYDFSNSSDTLNIFNETLPASGSGIVYSDTMFSFSPFTIGYGYPSVLSNPLQFAGQLLPNNHAQLQWKVGNPEDVHHFNVQYSTNGRDFSSIGLVNATAKNNYEFIHTGLASGKNYYRLQVNRKSGMVDYSKTELLQVGSLQTFITGLGQNPISNGQAVLQLQSAKNQHCNVTVLDIAGRVLWQQVATVLQGKNAVRLNLSGIPNGYYFMHVVTHDGATGVLPFVK